MSYTLVPIAAGYLMNRLLPISVLFVAEYYPLPAATLIFWFFLGSWFARREDSALCAVLLGNMVGIASLLLWCWQFLLLSGESRNVMIALIAQLFTSCALPIAAHFFRLFLLLSSSWGITASFFFNLRALS